MYNGEWQLGTGHGMWSFDEDDNLLYVFHARTTTTAYGRDTFVRRVHFASDGMPIFDMEQDEEVAPANRTVTVTVTVTGEPAPALDVTAAVAARCVAGKVVQTVTLTNGESFPVSRIHHLPYGTKSFPSLGAGKTASAAFTTRAVSIAEAGTVQVTATATVGGAPVTVGQQVAYGTVSCG